MKKILYLLLIVQAVFFVSCEKDLESEGVSKKSIAIYLEGSDLLTIPKGTTFVDPGYKAVDGNTDADVTNKLEIDNPVDVNSPGYYIINYSIKNSDGFLSTASRQVVIYDPNAPNVNLTGKYLAGGKRIRSNGTESTFTKLSVTINKLAPGFFSVSDFLGGYYDQGLGYADLIGAGASAAAGYFQLNSDNTITLVSSHVPYWGDELQSLTDGVYDPNTKTITWVAGYASSKFYVTLNFVE